MSQTPHCLACRWPATHTVQPLNFAYPLLFKKLQFLFNCLAYPLLFKKLQFLFNCLTDMRLLLPDSGYSDQLPPIPKGGFVFRTIDSDGG